MTFNKSVAGRSPASINFDFVTSAIRGMAEATDMDSPTTTTLREAVILYCGACSHCSELDVTQLLIGCLVSSSASYSLVARSITKINDTSHIFCHIRHRPIRSLRGPL